MAKFKVGQQVELYSKMFRELNGLHIVEQVFPPIKGQELERNGELDFDHSYALVGLAGRWAERSLSFPFVGG